MTEEEWYPMPMTTPRDLFLHELSDAMSAEQQILKMLPELQKESQHPEIKQALQHHEEETKQQVQNLNLVFEQLGAKPEQTTCYAVKGLGEEHKALHKEKPSPEVLEMANLGGAAKTEHYEIAAYTGLLEKARAMGQTQAVQLLQQNLAQEQTMLRQVEQIGQQLTQQMAATAGASSTGQQPSAGAM
jgi:ferritin-like metal-binding protein YciE